MLSSVGVASAGVVSGIVVSGTVVSVSRVVGSVGEVTSGFLFWCSATALSMSSW